MGFFFLLSFLYASNCSESSCSDVSAPLLSLFGGTLWGIGCRSHSLFAGYPGLQRRVGHSFVSRTDGRRDICRVRDHGSGRCKRKEFFVDNLGPLYEGESRAITLKMDQGRTPSFVPPGYFEGDNRIGTLASLIVLRKAATAAEYKALFERFKVAIFDHYEQKLQMTFFQMALVFGSGYVYQQHEALDQVSKGHNPDDHVAGLEWSHVEAHVATAPCLLVKDGEKKRVLGKGTPFFENFNMTTLLPRFVNDVDSAVEFSSKVEGISLRQFLELELNQLSLKKTTVPEAFARFSARVISHIDLKTEKGVRGVKTAVYQVFKDMATFYQRKIVDPAFRSKLMFGENESVLMSRLKAARGNFPPVFLAAKNSVVRNKRELELMTRAAILRVKSATERSREVSLLLVLPTPAVRKKILDVLKNKEVMAEAEKVLPSQFSKVDQLPLGKKVKAVLSTEKVSQVCLWAIHEAAQSWYRVDGITPDQFHDRYFAKEETFFRGVNSLIEDPSVTLEINIRFH